MKFKARRSPCTGFVYFEGVGVMLNSVDLFLKNLTAKQDFVVKTSQTKFIGARVLKFKEEKEDRYVYEGAKGIVELCTTKFNNYFKRVPNKIYYKII